MKQDYIVRITGLDCGVTNVTAEEIQNFILHAVRLGLRTGAGIVHPQHYDDITVVPEPGEVDKPDPAVKEPRQPVYKDPFGDLNITVSGCQYQDLLPSAEQQEQIRSSLQSILGVPSKRVQISWSGRSHLYSLMRGTPYEDLSTILSRAGIYWTNELLGSSAAGLAERGLLKDDIVRVEEFLKGYETVLKSPQYEKCERLYEAIPLNSIARNNDEHQAVYWLEKVGITKLADLYAPHVDRQYILAAFGGHDPHGCIKSLEEMLSDYGRRLDDYQQPLPTDTHEDQNPT